MELFEKTWSQIKEDEEKQKILDSMTGKPSFELCPKSRIHTIDNYEHQLALEFRLQARDAAVINKEKNFVDRMVDKELAATVAKFPKLANKLSSRTISQSENQQRADNGKELEGYYDEIFNLADEGNSVGSKSIDADDRIQNRPLTSMKLSAQEFDFELNNTFPFEKSRI